MFRVSGRLVSVLSAFLGLACRGGGLAPPSWPRPPGPLLPLGGWGRGEVSLGPCARGREMVPLSHPPAVPPAGFLVGPMAASRAPDLGPRTGDSSPKHMSQGHVQAWQD